MQLQTPISLYFRPVTVMMTCPGFSVHLIQIPAFEQLLSQMWMNRSTWCMVQDCMPASSLHRTWTRLDIDTLTLVLRRRVHDYSNMRLVAEHSLVGSPDCICLHPAGLLLAAGFSDHLALYFLTA